MNYYSINGFTDTINKIDYTYLVPNLFRLCYVQPSVAVPNICLLYNDNDIVVNNYPVLLDEIYIKSFLYFNFPSSYKDVSYINTFLYNIINLENYVLEKARNTTYGSITLSNVIYNAIYDQNSMLTQLIYFLNYIKNSNNTYTNEQVVAPFYVTWDYTTACVKNIYTKKTFFVGVNDYNNVIGIPTAQFLSFLKNSFFNIFPNGDILNYNEILVVYKYGINMILKYASEVYEDVLVQINYFLTCKQYCNKDYMNINNLPILFVLYNNFYKNQIYTIKNLIHYVKPQDADPYKIPLQTYIDNFKSYYTDNKLGIILKTVVISSSEAIIFCYTNYSDLPNDRTTKYYQYFYINTNSPSPVQLYNYWASLDPQPDYIGKTVEDFSIQFFEVGVIGQIESYLNLSNSKSYVLTKTFINGGLYPPDTVPSVIGYRFNTYDDLIESNINSTLYLTFQTNLGKPTGLPLVYYKNDS